MMSRSVPVSVVLHALAMAALLLWGDRVTTQEAHTPQVIAVRLVEAPRTNTPTPEVAVTEAEPEAIPEPVVKKVDPVRPPKELPKEKPKEPPKEKPKPVVAKPTTKAGAAKPTTGTPMATAGDETGVAGPAVSGTDTDFPFAYYLQAIKSAVVANWDVHQFNFGARTQVSCSVHFVIGRGGAITQVRLVRNSGLGVYDREALRAVQSSRLPPLPPQYRGSDLGVTFDFKQEPGSQ